MPIRFAARSGLEKVDHFGIGQVMLVYLAAVCGIVHYWWQVKTGVLSPLRLTIVLASLLLAAGPGMGEEEES